ncbi:Cro/CI family transcriptional regulator [Psychromonas sp. PT13]|uniref:Cro/CI family transcriptional regulator n=1 Tax=Psychromonas sp. PT13 TaxID=3439547 RepID=UPI003EB928AA
MLKSEVLEYFGTQEKIAKALKISQASVSRWGAVIPRLRGYEIEKLTNGKLKAELTQSV